MTGEPIQNPACKSCQVSMECRQVWKRRAKHGGKTPEFISAVVAFAVKEGAKMACINPGVR